MPPGTRSTGRGRGSGRGEGAALPTTAEELAKLISQHVTAATGQHVSTQNFGRGGGHGTGGGTPVRVVGDASGIRHLENCFV
jgi:hypothetical protein